MTNPTELVGKRTDASLPPANFWTTAGKTLESAGNTFLQYASIMSGGYVGSSCYGGLSAFWDNMVTPYDQFQRNMVLNLGACGGYGNSGMGLGNGINTPTNQGDLKWVNNNEAFDKLDSATMAQLKAIEEQIKEQQAIISDANRSTDERAAAGKVLDGLKKQYKNLESKMKLNGQTPSQFLKKTDYSLYTNLDPEELRQIQEANSEIAALKKEAEELQKEYNDKEQAAMAKINQASMMGMMAQSVISKDDQETLKNLKTQYEEKCKEISEKIKELEKCVSEAVKDDSVANFAIVRHSVDAKKADEQARAASAKLGTDIATGLYKDGNLISDTAQLKDDLRKTQTTYDPANINKVVDELFAIAKTKGTKDDFIKALQSDEKVHSELERIIGAGTDGGRNERAAILVGILDSILGGTGQYARLQKTGSTGSAWSAVSRIVSAANSYTPPARSNPSTTGNGSGANVPKTAPGVGNADNAALVALRCQKEDGQWKQCDKERLAEKKKAALEDMNMPGDPNDEHYKATGIPSKGVRYEKLNPNINEVQKKILYAAILEECIDANGDFNPEKATNMIVSASKLHPRVKANLLDMFAGAYSTYFADGAIREAKINGYIHSFAYDSVNTGVDPSNVARYRSASHIEFMKIIKENITDDDVKAIFGTSDSNSPNKPNIRNLQNILIEKATGVDMTYQSNWNGYNFYSYAYNSSLKTNLKGPNGKPIQWLHEVVQKTPRESVNTVIYYMMDRYNVYNFGHATYDYTTKYIKNVWISETDTSEDVGVIRNKHLALYKNASTW